MRDNSQELNFNAIITEEDFPNNKRDQKNDFDSIDEHKSNATSIPLIQTSKQLDDFLKDQTKHMPLNIQPIKENYLQ